jgi:hypothetical protein
MKDLVSHLVVLKASQVALTAIPSKYPDGYRCTVQAATKLGTIRSCFNCSLLLGIPVDDRLVEEVR